MLLRTMIILGFRFQILDMKLLYLAGQNSSMYDRITIKKKCLFMFPKLLV
jgi:hypothetical protein